MNKMGLWGHNRVKMETMGSNDSLSAQESNMRIKKRNKIKEYRGFTEKRKGS